MDADTLPRDFEAPPPSPPAPMSPMTSPWRLPTEGAADGIVLLEDVDLNASASDLARRFTSNSWWNEHRMGERNVLGLISGSLLGVTTALATVRDRFDNVVGESHSMQDAEGIKEFLPKEGAPYKTKMEWDSDTARDMANFYLVANGKPERGLFEGVVSSAPLEHKVALKMEVADSLAALARASTHINSRPGTGCMFLNDYMCLPIPCLRKFAADPEVLRDFHTRISVGEPLGMFQRFMAATDNLISVMPIGGITAAEARGLLPMLKTLFPARLLVVVHLVTDDSKLMSIVDASPKLMSVLANAGGEPRRGLMATCSGGSGVLLQMEKCAQFGLKMVVLDGSGRLSDIWRDVYPERASAEFDAVVHSKRLSIAFCYEAGGKHLNALRVVLSHGDVVIHPVANQASGLEQLCVQLLLGDPLLDVAAQQAAQYTAAAARYQFPRTVLLASSILLALLSTIFAILVGDDDTSSAMYYAVIALPAVLLVVDQIDVYVGTTAAAAATERAAGMVTHHTYLYQTRTGEFSDHAIARARQQATGPRERVGVDTYRQQLFAERLSAVAERLSAGKALVGTPSKGEVAPEPGATPRRGEPDVITGDEYLKTRLVKGIEESHAAAKRLMWICLCVRLGLFAAGAVGSVLATLGYAKYVTISVAVSTALNRALSATNMEKRRHAHARAATELTSARTAWLALPREMKTQQQHLDKLVLRTEACIERTLPPPEESESSQAPQRA
eukprot:TRINITY_DN4091_c0_g5_i1.p1 TRINITY_DN4091_c0_g5~~TRINITY_DN4091_c0_g5_i1.p1  ORF type:complete len:732 (+),score=240.88 TRINITY_DN4091_c0_g5_i1:124-2319(+)